MDTTHPTHRLLRSCIIHQERCGSQVSSEGKGRLFTEKISITQGQESQMKYDQSKTSIETFIFNKSAVK